MKTEFSYNEHDVCTNPHVIMRELTEPYYFMFQIKTAMTYKGYWITGYSLGFRNGDGIGVPCSPKSNPAVFGNEQDAVWAAYRILKNYLLNHHTGGSSSQPDADVELWTPGMMAMLDDAVQPKLFQI